MKLFVGLDVSLSKTKICVISEHGKIQKEAEVASQPEASTAGSGTEWHHRCICFKAGLLSQRQYRGLAG